MTLPLDCVLAIQGVCDLVPADLLVLRVAGQAVEGERDAAGCGVVALEHEGVNLSPEVLIRQTLLCLIL